MLLDIVRELTSLPGPTGEEGPVREKLREWATPHCDSVFVDTMGNLICQKGKEGPLVMLAAHMDEVGFMVMDIDDKGRLRYQPLGGIDPRVVVSKRVRVGKKGIPGVIGAKPIHLQSEAEYASVMKHRELYIDIGCTDGDSAKALVDIGDSAVFDSEFVEFGEGFVKAKALDDRAGCAILLELLRGEYPCRLAVVFTTQEEIGLRGARVAAHRIQPDIGIVVESTAANDGPGIPEHRRVTVLGQGPALTLMDGASISNPRLNAALVRTAQAKGIRWQWKKGTTGGNDAGAISRAGKGAATAVISMPCRYIHSPSSVLCVEDMQQTLTWIRAFLESGANLSE